MTLLFSLLLLLFYYNNTKSKLSPREYYFLWVEFYAAALLLLLLLLFYHLDIITIISLGFSPNHLLYQPHQTLNNIFPQTFFFCIWLATSQQQQQQQHKTSIKIYIHKFKQNTNKTRNPNNNVPSIIKIIKKRQQQQPKPFLQRDDGGAEMKELFPKILLTTTYFYESNSIWALMFIIAKTKRNEKMKRFLDPSKVVCLDVGGLYARTSLEQKKKKKMWSAVYHSGWSSMKSASQLIITDKMWIADFYRQ